jgi:hypothetical protein
VKREVAMNRHPLPAAAFTIIEMMIALGLGMLIVYTAVAGFRTAAQTVATANRLSLENSLLRSGYFEAQIQLDFWTNLDDPTRPDAERPLKSAALSVGRITDWTGQGRDRGLPFTPMKTLQSRGIWPVPANDKVPRTPSGTTLPGSGGARGNTIMPRALADLSVADWELDRAWDPSYYWSPHDPRTWCRANLAEKDRPNNGIGNDGADNLPPIINGRYAIFANTNPGTQNLATYTIKPDLNSLDQAARLTTQSVNYGGYPGSDIHSWYYNQLDRLVDAMGYAAFCDYLPANSIYTWYSDRGDRTVGGINKFGISPNYNFTNWDGDQRTSRGIYRNTYSRSYGYVSPQAWNDWGVEPFPTSGSPLTGDGLRQKFYQHYNSDYGATDAGGAQELRAFLRHTIWHEPLITAKPEHWPDLSVAVGRLLKNAHFVAVAKVSRFSPLTGELIELSWCGLGTTLRGARQQRSPTTGWARWDNAASATIDPNLDTP